MITEAAAPKPQKKTVNWSAIRADYPILDQQVHGQPLIYFDNDATTQKPRAVVEALRHYYECDNANVHRGIHELSNRATAAFEAARARAAKFINARSADEIIFTRGTTEGINLVAQAWGSKNIKAGDRILLTEMEHHSNIVPWQLLAERSGAELVYLPITGDIGLLDLNRLDEHLGKRVKLLALTHISNSLGTINPVVDLCAHARQLGIATLVDAEPSDDAVGPNRVRAAAPAAQAGRNAREGPAHGQHPNRPSRWGKHRVWECANGNNHVEPLTDADERG